ncbi:hypothetical protein [Reinekea blandensis]|uniref:AB hydrolase-1 domain-containing protein n=1 Tax=Reinekea blandensis MED297 TaxID=314283 RepID=A4BA25_9GAMM|nr:hypothetical protein [Reinekea blandensis]EAR10781.1 hypothetical protein MED297_09736 [Reinekea sp. MED297] [Reinekea blandensis MED297]
MKPNISTFTFGGTRPGPVSVYLHGKGGFGNTAGLYEYEDFPRLLRDGTYQPACPFVVLHAQSGEHWNLAELNDVLHLIARQYPDRSIHLMGYSRGGTAVYRYLNTYPDTPVASATIINARLVANYAGLKPIRLFHAVDDHSEPVERVQNFVDQQSQRHVLVTLTVTAGNHFNIGQVARQLLTELAQ